MVNNIKMATWFYYQSLGWLKAGLIYLLAQCLILCCWCSTGGGNIGQGELHFGRASGWRGNNSGMQGLKQSSHQLVCFWPVQNNGPFAAQTKFSPFVCLFWFVMESNGVNWAM